MLFTPHLWLPTRVFAGLGDISGSAAGYWGLRAYTKASIGSNAIKLRRDSDNTTQTFVTVAGGGLDLASISTFKVAANLFVDTLFDQSGGGNNMAQATLANQPQFTLNGLGSLPIMSFVAGTPLYLKSASLFNLGPPYTFTSVARRTANFTTAQVAFAGIPNQQLAFDATVNTVYVFANGGGTITNTATDNVYHSMGMMITATGTSSKIDVDGADLTGNPGNTGWVNQNLFFGVFGDLTTGLTGSDTRGYCLGF